MRRPLIFTVGVILRASLGIDFSDDHESLGRLKSGARAAPGRECLNRLERTRMWKRSHFLRVSMQGSPLRICSQGNVDKSMGQECIDGLGRIPFRTRRNFHTVDPAYAGTRYRPASREYRPMTTNVVNVQVACM